jgi:hypothetical protein
LATTSTSSPSWTPRQSRITAVTARSRSLIGARACDACAFA